MAEIIMFEGARRLYDDYGDEVSEVDIQDEDYTLVIASSYDIAMRLRASYRDCSMPKAVDPCQLYQSQCARLIISKGFTDNEKTNIISYLPQHLYDKVLTERFKNPAKRETALKEAQAYQAIRQSKEYREAVAFFSRAVEADIDNDFVNDHAEELIYCHQNGKGIIDFDFWTQYETLLHSKMTFEEYIFVDSCYDDDPMGLTEDDTKVISMLADKLDQYRSDPSKTVTDQSPLLRRIRQAHNQKETSQSAAAHDQKRIGNEITRI